MLEKINVKVFWGAIVTTVVVIVLVPGGLDFAGDTLKGLGAWIRSIGGK